MIKIMIEVKINGKDSLDAQLFSNNELKASFQLFIYRRSPDYRISFRKHCIHDVLFSYLTTSTI